MKYSGLISLYQKLLRTQKDRVLVAGLAEMNTNLALNRASPQYFQDTMEGGPPRYKKDVREERILSLSKSRSVE